MSRLVQPAVVRAAPVDDAQFESMGVPESNADPHKTIEKSTDSYIERIAKYIPGEVLAAYMFLDGVAQYEIAKNSNAAVGFGEHKPLIAVVIGLIFAPLYIAAIGRQQQAPWKLHALVTTAAFLIWAYAIKGNFFVQQPLGLYVSSLEKTTLYNPDVAIYTLVVFTLLSGLIVPQPLRLAPAPPKPAPPPSSPVAATTGNPSNGNFETLNADATGDHIVHVHHEVDTEPDLPFVLDGSEPGGEFESNNPDKVKLWVPGADTRFKMRTKGQYAQGYPVGAVIHSTEGRSLKGDANAEDTVNEGVGENYCYICISSTGRIYQSAPLDRFGSHAGECYWPGLGFRLNNKLIGIEVCCAGVVRKDGDGYKPGWNERFTEGEVRYAAKAGNVTEAGFYHRFNAKQEEALLKLLMWLKRNNPDVFRFDYVAGHDEIATLGSPGSPKEKTLGRKQDPGGSLSMPMAEYREMLFSRYAQDVAAAPDGNFESTRPVSKPFRLPAYAEAALGQQSGIPWAAAQVRQDFNYYSGLVNNSVHVFGSRAVFYASKFDVDNDGSAGNAAGDPCHQADTSLHDRSGKPLSADDMPFIVLPKRGQQPYLWSGLGVGVGDLAILWYKNGAMCAAIIGDVGPSTKIGEGSTSVARALGINPDPNTGGVQDIPPGIMHMVFPGSRKLLAQTSGQRPRTDDTRETIAARAQELLALLKASGNGTGA